MLLLLFCSLCGCGERKEAEQLIGTAAEAAALGEVQTGSAGGEAGESSAGIAGTGENLTESSAQVAVYVCGAVERPGIVYLPEGSRKAEALEAAGGFSEDADRNYVNLAAKIKDGEQIYFPI